MTPMRPPRTDADCWPFPCRDYHETAVHQDGSEPCMCPCHEIMPSDPRPSEYRERQDAE